LRCNVIFYNAIQVPFHILRHLFDNSPRKNIMLDIFIKYQKEIKIRLHTTSCCTMRSLLVLSPLNKKSWNCQIKQVRAKFYYKNLFFLWNNTISRNINISAIDVLPLANKSFYVSTNVSFCFEIILIALWKLKFTIPIAVYKHGNIEN